MRLVVALTFMLKTKGNTSFHRIFDKVNEGACEQTPVSKTTCARASFSTEEAELRSCGYIVGNSLN
jgi:hypothetical protein